MKRRSLLKLGIASGVVLAVAGGSLALLKPGLLADGKLSPAARQLMRAVALAVFDGLLPAEAAAREARLAAHLDQLDANIAGFPPHLRGELSQLLSLLTSSGGRLALTGLTSDWAAASVADVQASLQAMSLSSLGLNQQIYHALRDLSSLVFFSNAASWQLVGYPGPREIP
ncbi:hypothetical protein PFX98_01785 [Paucibacter sediminis]|uniref:Twin-arginine translocation pathway signal protein n=1 Tax=Paucibacter sediminis TaxID=3019553 RepID=A0AA95NHA6_9BURK|nr:hypothetical protein [Paucibacter sp. S2-9]WIT12363.1 hypothetical protein PFX98_01785 [Paucibacter sp. S2-9]